MARESWSITFRHFWKGVICSYRKTIAWRPNGLYWRAWFAGWLATWSMSATCLTFLALLVIGGNYLGNPAKLMTFDDRVSIVYFCSVYLWPGMSLTFGVWWAFTPLRRGSNIKSDAEYEEKLRRERNDGYKMACHGSPVGIVFWMLYGIVWLVAHSPRLIARMPPSSLWL